MKLLFSAFLSVSLAAGMMDFDFEICALFAIFRAVRTLYALNGTGALMVTACGGDSPNNAKII